MTTKLITSLLLLSLCFTTQALSLKVGVLSNDPPFSMQIAKNNLFSGFEPQLIGEICKRLQANCNYIGLDFEELFNQVNTKKIDLAIGQISITLEREGNFSFSLPYMVSDGQIITLNKSSIKNMTDLKTATFGIFKGSLYKNYLLDKFGSDITINEYSNSDEAFKSLRNKDVDAIMFSKIDEDFWVSNNARMNQFRVIGDPIMLGNGFGIMANIKSTDLIMKINQILKTMEADGSYLKIYNLYFGGIKGL